MADQAENPASSQTPIFVIAARFAMIRASRITDLSTGNERSCFRPKFSLLYPPRGERSERHGVRRASGADRPCASHPSKMEWLLPDFILMKSITDRVNSLPKWARDYIHNVSTFVGASEVRELTYLRDQNRALVKLIAELKAENRRLTKRLERK
jgi:hypothetical protein